MVYRKEISALRVKTKLIHYKTINSINPDAIARLWHNDLQF